MFTTIAIIWSGVFFLYYLLKDYFIAYLFKNVKTPIPWPVSLATSILVLLLNNFYAAEYDRYLDMAVMKGTLRFPPLYLIILISDILGTTFFILVLRYRLGPDVFNAPFTRVVFNIISIIFGGVMFTPVMIRIWTAETTRNFTYDYY